MKHLHTGFTYLFFFCNLPTKFPKCFKLCTIIIPEKNVSDFQKSIYFCPKNYFIASYAYDTALYACETNLTGVQTKIEN